MTPRWKNRFNLFVLIILFARMEILLCSNMNSRQINAWFSLLASIMITKSLFVSNIWKKSCFIRLRSTHLSRKCKYSWQVFLQKRGSYSMGIIASWIPSTNSKALHLLRYEERLALHFRRLCFRILHLSTLHLISCWHVLITWCCQIYSVKHLHWN
jgi:hypothetical protein